MGGKCHHGKQAEGSRCSRRALEEGHSRSNWRLNWDGGKDEATRLSFGGVFGCSENVPRERGSKCNQATKSKSGDEVVVKT